MQAVITTILAALAALAYAFPMDELLIESLDGDTAVVESKIREVRQTIHPQKIKDLLAAGNKGAYVHSYDDGEGDAHGYHRKSEEKGSDGYKHFDSFHKKDSDKYGYEKHSELGKNGKYTDATDGKSSKYQEKDSDNSKKNKDDKGDETRSYYKVVEDVDEDDGSHYEGGGDGENEEYSNSDAGEYSSGEENGHYTEVSDGGDHESYTDGGDGNHYSSGDGESSGDSGHYSEGGSDASGEHYEGDEGSSEHYAGEGEGGDEEGDGEHYAEEGDEDY